MSYLVLARKWRPQKFEDVVGQQHITQTLQNAIAQNRVAHAFLFTGSRGVGKTSTARIFAKALNCHHAPCSEPCNECPSCLEITEGKSLDVIEIDGASNRGIDPIRELREAVRYAPARDRYKIYIIDEVHMLTTEAFNALLKTLEEPPPHAIFIFATTDPNKVPVTIVSRCQQYDFKRITINDLVAHLKKISVSENIPFEDGALQLIARMARGGARDALSSMDQIIAFAAPPITAEKASEILGVASRETLTTMVNAILNHDVDTAIACLQKADQYGQDLALFAFDLLAYLRDITLVVATKNSQGLTELAPNEIQFLAPALKNSTVDRLQRIFQIWYAASEIIPKSLSPKLLMEMTIVKMCAVENVIPLAPILQKLDALTKMLAPNLPPNALDQVRAYLVENNAIPSDSEKKKFNLSNHLTDDSSAAHTKSYSDQNVNKNSYPLKNSSENVPSTQLPQPPETAAPRIAEPPCASPPSANERAYIPEESTKNEFSDKENDTIKKKSEDSLNSEQKIQNSVYESAPATEQQNNAEPQKKLAVSELSPQNTARFPSAKMGESKGGLIWGEVVASLPKTIVPILEHSLVRELSEKAADIVIPTEYSEIFDNEKRKILKNALTERLGSGIDIQLHFEALESSSDTLAGQREQANQLQRIHFKHYIEQSEIFQKALSLFKVDPSGVRFDIR